MPSRSGRASESAPRRDEAIELRFRPSARLQRYLGRELISDPNLAILEFVKNAYDAGAATVLVQFVLTEEETRLVIADDGVGMDLDSFQENWMHPGFSAKSDEAPKNVRERRAPDTPAGSRMSKRTPVGEKGLGRLAAGRLGEVMDVYTRPSARDRWLHVHFDWNEFEDMTKHMDDVVIPYEYLEEPPEVVEERDSGTVIVIRDLQLDWAGKLRGRPAFGRSTTRLGRLKEDLELLLRPLDMASPDFEVVLLSDAVAEEIELGPITPSTAAQDAPYRYEFTFEVDGRGVPQVQRTLWRSRGIAREFRKKVQEDLGSGPLAQLAKQDEEGRPATLECGPFRGVFLYKPPPPRTRAKQEDVVGHGVLLYRDDMLVEPYGLGDNDWIGVEARKAQRQGHALIQPATFWGEVHISRADNPELRDMANRQGLLENHASEDFFAHLRAEFRRFEEVVGAELEQRWTSREDRAAAVAKEQLKAVTLRTKSFAHHLRQPLMAMGGELLRLERLARDESIPPKQRERLLEIYERLVAYHSRAEHLVNRYAEASLPEFRSVSVRKLMSAVREEARPVAEDHGVQLRFERPPDEELVLPGDLLEEALVELVVNAIEAPRPAGRRATVVVSSEFARRELTVDVTDNGLGMPGVEPGTPLSDTHLEPTKGRPADGIVQVCNVLTFARGSAEVLDTSDRGTRIRVKVSGRLDSSGSR